MCVSSTKDVIIYGEGLGGDTTTLVLRETDGSGKVHSLAVCIDRHTTKKHTACLSSLQCSHWSSSNWLDIVNLNKSLALACLLV